MSDRWQVGQAGVLLALAGLIPSIFDPHTADVFNLPKFAALVLGAALLVGVGAAGAIRRDLVHGERISQRRPTALSWAAGGVLVSSALSTLTSVDRYRSLIGARDSYDGLVLAAALVVTYFATQRAFRSGGVSVAMGVLYLVGGGASVAYGLVQLHDRLLGHAAHWDPVHWGRLLFPNIFSTFGNPDHLGGFLAIIAPVGVAVIAISRQRLIRVLAGAVLVALAIELLASASRGAWLATIVAGAVLGVGLAPEVRRRWRLVAAVGAVALVAGSAIIALSGRGVVGAKLDELARSGPTSSIGVRMQEWTTGIDIGLAHPLLGTGPDTFGLVFPGYETKQFVSTVGPGLSPDGAHNLFVNTFADNGLLGLAALLVLLGAISNTSLRTWRELRHREFVDDPPARQRARQERYALAGLSGGVAAYVTQASFDVQQVGLSFSFWLLVGLIGALAVPRGTGLPRTSRRLVPRVARLGIAGAALWLVPISVLGVSHLYLAEGAYWSALALPAPRHPQNQRLEHLRAAADLDPWQPLYRSELGLQELQTGMRLPAASPEGARLLALGFADYRRALRLAPTDVQLLHNFAGALLELQQQGRGTRRTRSVALAALRRARRLSPNDPTVAADLRIAEVEALGTGSGTNARTQGP
ncbi:MAG: O-antigen ligase family protein [Acidimicrobiales bacterium]